ncbi:PAS domain-containing protein [Gloeocapsopsis crepidinum LEGE 06123]|uniref:histidine kinase n=2 Tax=Gloeocapsopsis crepidinum TaxID=693223 RepID=A0ABR9UNN0_9CHRO|nr:PAS domain-containing protein [Gloeocapsopsis crepidinum LEGE 06123]
MCDRAAKLYQQTSLPSYQTPELASDSLEELRIAVEELHVAEEELLQQNEELMITRAQLEAQTKRYQELFEFAPDSYLVTDTFGIIKEANRAAATMLHVPQQFLVSKPLINFIPYEERSIFRAKLQQLHNTHRLQEWEIRVSPRHSTELDAALTVDTIRDSEGNAVGWRWLMRDITARKQAEAKLRDIELQNLQLQETARIKSHFLAIMSHELRSPMNAIIGFSQLLLRSPYDRLSPQQQNMVQRILNSGRHLLRLIDDVLDFSRLEAGHLELQSEEFNLTELVSATTEEMHSLVEQKNLKLQLQLNLQNSLVVNDKHRLRQVLINLLSNAIKFTNVGSIQVDVWELSPERIAIAVQDTGIGIAQADLQDIFTEFRQANQTLVRQHGGTGLGLAITDRLVQMMHGLISVTSELGQGSTFQVEIPRRVSL